MTVERENIIVDNCLLRWNAPKAIKNERQKACLKDHILGKRFNSCIIVPSISKTNPPIKHPVYLSRESGYQTIIFVKNRAPKNQFPHPYNMMLPIYVFKGVKPFVNRPTKEPSNKAGISIPLILFFK